MKKLELLLLSGCFILLFSCQFPVEKPGDFKLLPIPHQFDVEGSSKLKYDDIQYYFGIEWIFR